MGRVFSNRYQGEVLKEGKTSGRKKARKLGVKRNGSGGGGNRDRTGVLDQGPLGLRPEKTVPHGAKRKKENGKKKDDSRRGKSIGRSSQSHKWFTRIGIHSKKPVR